MFLVQCPAALLVRLATAVVLFVARGGQMKRSEQVSLAFMGVAAFAATFASATLYMAKPGSSAMAKPGSSAIAAPGSSAMATPGSSAMAAPGSSAMATLGSSAMATPGSSAVAKPGASAQGCTARPDGAQNCELRSTSSYLVHAGSGTSAAEPKKTQGAALISNANARSSTPASSASVVRGGFGATGASTSFRASAGG